MEDILKAVQTLDIKDRVIVLKGDYTRTQLDAIRKGVKQHGAIGVMCIPEEDSISSQTIDEAIQYLQNLKEKSNG